jgi:hypothetical protein
VSINKTCRDGDLSLPHTTVCDFQADFGTVRHNKLAVEKCNVFHFDFKA